MSAYLARLTEHNVQIYSDAAFCESGNYNLTTIVSKCVPITGFPLAITGRGQMDLLAELAGNLHKFCLARGNVDDAIDDFADYLVRLEAEKRRLHAMQDFLVAGFSADIGPFMYMVIVGNPEHKSEIANVNGGYDLFTLTPLFEFWTGGVFDEAEFFQHGFTLAKFKGENIDDEAVRLFEAWRQKAVFAPGDDRPLWGVGGQLHRTTITESGVEFEAIGQWPDLIGKPISPSGKLVRA